MSTQNFADKVTASGNSILGTQAVEGSAFGFQSRGKLDLRRGCFPFLSLFFFSPVSHYDISYFRLL